MAKGASTSHQESKTLAVTLWVLTIFFWIIPGVVFYLVKKDDNYVADQAKEAINWGLTAFVGYIIGLILLLIIIGVVVLWAVYVVNLIFCILGVIKTLNGAPYRVPFAIRLLK